MGDTFFLAVWIGGTLARWDLRLGAWDRLLWPCQLGEYLFSLAINRMQIDAALEAKSAHSPTGEEE